MSILTSADLRTLFQIILRADIKVAEVPTAWQAIQKLELASKSGEDYEVARPGQSLIRNEVDGNR